MSMLLDRRPTLEIISNIKEYHQPQARMLVRFSKALAFITGFLLQHAIGAQDGFGQLLEPICTNISTHDYVPPDVSFANFESILQSLNFNVSLQGIVNIAARYYEPQRLYLFPNQFNTLQFLVHGGTYTRNYVKSFHRLPRVRI
jgi:hypothetical protein